MDEFIAALTQSINRSYTFPTTRDLQLPYPFNVSLTTVDYSVPTPNENFFPDPTSTISSIESTRKSIKPTSSLKSTKGTSAKSTTKSVKSTASTIKSTTIKSTLKSTTGKSTKPTSSLISTKGTSVKSTTQPQKSTTIKSTLKTTTGASASTKKSASIKSTLKSTTGTPAKSTTKLTLKPTTKKSTIKTTQKSSPATKKTATLKSTLKSIPQTSQMIPKPTPTTIVQKPTQSKKGKKKVTLPYYPEHTNLPTPPKPAVPPTIKKSRIKAIASNFLGKAKKNRVARSCFETALNGALTVIVAFREAFANCYLREDINPVLVILKMCSRTITKALMSCRSLFGPTMKLQCAGIMVIAIADLIKEMVEVAPTLSSRDNKLKSNCLKQHFINIGCAAIILIGDIAYCSFKIIKNPF